ncbi:MAG: hypothetical protein IIT84_04705 [Oscillospiraceae bacterium]|nr:hypothetical protein [Oscillospiraceae bacterium]MBQ2330193.1 hypothetical protein [Oscillospiraceae bacterium]MBQ3952476.1 hypothetical protein [Oscillospiraceae bacterium]MBQ5514967.1 hypothetical protein [Oscillospiraceae bacterium]
MPDLRTHLNQRYRRLSAVWLKNAAAVIMLIVAAGRIIIQLGLIRLDTYTGETLSAAMDADPNLMTLSGVASIIQLMRGLLPPLFAFLLVEGFVHTSSYGHYLGGVAITAVLSEFAYDYAMTGKVLEFSAQNPMLGLAVCLIMLYGLRLAERREMIERVIISLLIILASTFWVIVIRSECGIELVLLTAVLYCFRDKLVIKYVLGIIISLMDAFGPISFCAIIFYSGKRDLRISKYFYYGLYPAHYLIFGLIARCFLIK